MDKTKPREIGGAFPINLWNDGDIVASEKDVLGFGDPFFEKRWGDRALIDIEERDVVVGDLVEKDDELHEVGVSLLPERFLAAAEEIVQERGDIVGEGVRIEVIVERVVAVFGIETDFDVILGSLVTIQDVSYLAAKVPLHLQDKTADPLFLVGRLVREDLFGKRKHAARSLAASNRTQDSDSRKQTALGNGEPSGRFGWHRFARVTHFSYDEKQLGSQARIGILRKVFRRDGAARFEREDVNTGKYGRANKIGGGE